MGLAIVRTGNVIINAKYCTRTKIRFQNFLHFKALEVIGCFLEIAPLRGMKEIVKWRKKTISVLCAE